MAKWLQIRGHVQSIRGIKQHHRSSAFPEGSPTGEPREADTPGSSASWHPRQTSNELAQSPQSDGLSQATVASRWPSAES